MSNLLKAAKAVDLDLNGWNARISTACILKRVDPSRDLSIRIAYALHEGIIEGPSGELSTEGISDEEILNAVTEAR